MALEIWTRRVGPEPLPLLGLGLAIFDGVDRQLVVGGRGKRWVVMC
jgi:hypothetical protein